MDWFPEAGVTRRRVLGSIGASVPVMAGCLGSGTLPNPNPTDWPQAGYDSGATYFKSAGSPPVEEPQLAWDASVWATDMQSDATLTDPGTWEIRTPLLIVDDRAYCIDGTIVDMADGRVRDDATTTGEGKRRDTECHHTYALIEFARTNAYRDGTLVATRRRGMRDHRGSAGDILEGLRPPPSVDADGWCGTTKRWTAGSRRGFDATAAAGRIEDGVVVTVVPGETGPFSVVAIDADDRRAEWETTVSHPVDRLRVEDGRVFAATSSETGGKLSVLDDTGISRTVETGAETTLVAVRDGIAYLRESQSGNSTASIVALDSETGEWRPLIDAPSALDDQLAGSTAGIGDIVVGPERLYTVVNTKGTDSDVCLAVNRDDQAIEWQRRLPTTTRITGTDDALYLHRADGRAVALEPSSGDRLWTYDRLSASANADPGRPVVGNDKLLFPYGKHLVALEAP
ncbi:outer membrane protein assembly factor BamB family protein [Halorhabdus salina]|uniref:outer membrane protein assembly factor BamB family protein n=1 Tax=Halorhabdus salina TaxID=2750670 RepID=UPI0015EEA961|nr:PQQ-binding-like beta-propeller repeat protein [Halorhabdus salina]